MTRTGTQCFRPFTTFRYHALTKGKRVRERSTSRGVSAHVAERERRQRPSLSFRRRHQPTTRNAISVQIPPGVKPGETFRVDLSSVTAQQHQQTSHISNTKEIGFQHGLFGCFDRGILQCLCMTCWAPCAMGQFMSRMRGRGCLCYTLFGALPLFHLHARTKIREQYLIEGDCQNDCLISTFCMPCSVYQILNEGGEKLGLRVGFCGCPGFCTDEDIMMTCSCCVNCCESCTGGCRRFCAGCCDI